MKPRSRGMSLGMKSKGLNFNAFKLGSYLIGLTSSFEGMTDFLAAVSVEDRPRISDELLKFFATHYNGWSFAVCLFKADAIKAQPIAYAYKPFNPDVLFFPTMDSHTGGAPVKQMVDVDHSLMKHVPAKSGPNASDFFSQNVPDFIRNTRYDVDELDGQEINGDYYVKVEDSIYKAKRLFETSFNVRIENGKTKIYNDKNELIGSQG